jgi:hypothetical protein
LLSVCWKTKNCIDGEYTSVEARADRGEHCEAAGVIATTDFDSAIYCVQALMKG